MAYQYGSADNRYFDKIDVDFALTTFALGARYRYAFTGWFHAGAHLGVTLNYATLTFEDRYMKYEQESDSVGYDVGVDTAFMPFFNEAAWVRGFLFTLSLDYKTIPLSDMGELRDVSGFGVRVGAGYVFTFGEKPKEASAAPAIPPPAVPPAEKPAAPEPAPAVDSPR
ncbi:MAG: hypothetical protein M5R36_12515 [Deltaproteobacteria bacterium]|nr:hypothetical protein [Deltaproteobacteria bacterium]